MNWAGDMTGAEMIAQFQNAYVPSLIQRNTIWTFHAGKPVHLLREPGGPVWVLQEYTKAVDPSLTPDNLNELGSKLKNLPKGWKFETKVLTKNLSLDTGRARRVGGHHSRRAALHLPGLRLRRGHQRQLRAVTCRRGCRTDRESRPRGRCERRSYGGTPFDPTDPGFGRGLSAPAREPKDRRSADRRDVPLCVEVNQGANDKQGGEEMTESRHVTGGRGARGQYFCGVSTEQKTLTNSAVVASESSATMGQSKEASFDPGTTAAPTVEWGAMTAGGLHHPIIGRRKRGSTVALLRRCHDLWAIYAKRRVAPIFREEIMLAVAGADSAASAASRIESGRDRYTSLKTSSLPSRGLTPSRSMSAGGRPSLGPRPTLGAI